MQAMSQDASLVSSSEVAAFDKKTISVCFAVMQAVRTDEIVPQPNRLLCATS